MLRTRGAGSAGFRIGLGLVGLVAAVLVLVLDAAGLPGPDPRTAFAVIAGISIGLIASGWLRRRRGRS